ncbi:MAG TPA: bifunctional tetrahydrofolate synthase/dihydrofolate synthase [Steroidobacteraceae bacterium]|jgi:dihydrofolate synthase/folylpolyglutamate synthase|nr:bifunctional tetrahydrofolate synthase/dihydrofolate synthase [Steroidobacteraceae bacterium]
MRTLDEWLRLQESVHPRSIDLGLERVAAVAHALALTAPAFRLITVAGTNGKGSVAALAESVLRARGVRTGLFTSPHLVRYNERIQVAGVSAGDAELLAAFERIEAARGTTTLTFFEYNTLAALEVFTRRVVQVAVLEVGLGGRLDATNLVSADVAVLVSVGLDHLDWLGDSLESIGAEKAGIFRSGHPAVLGSADMPASVFAVLKTLGVPALIAGRDFTWEADTAGWSYRAPGIALTGLAPPGLAGSIQYRNAATALAAVGALEGRVRLPGALDTRTVNTALAAVHLPGRLQIVPGPVEWILDIAHNEPAARVLATHLRERPAAAPGARTLAVVGVLADKDAGGIAAALAPLVDHWIVCALAGPRGASAGELLWRLKLATQSVTLADSVVRGCELARALARPGDRVVVFGSFHTVGPALEWLGLY